ncbi:MAG TPA: helix-turn-helix transcriptional regulator [Tepidisphaeraceae bacterium]|nr:helix-turn-helix transcriptional regulator [Tepidisphaeraceae bacterium]
MARKADLPPNAVSDYINKNYLPRVDTALALARALNVPLDWLADDRQDWPPPAKWDAYAAENLPDGLLMREVCRRLRLASLDIKDLIEKAERVDWVSISKLILEQPEGSPLPPSIAPEIDLGYSLLFADGRLLKFEASHIATAHWRDLPPIDTPEGELAMHVLLGRLRKLNDRPGLSAVESYLFSVASDRDDANPENIRAARAKLKNQIESSHVDSAGKSGPKSHPKKGA